MNKVFTLIMMLCIALTTNAQSRKMWDFTQGWEKSRINLDLDEATWTKDAFAADGSTTRWKDAKKVSGTLKANGEPIKELEGLQIGSAGLSSSGNYLLNTNAFRVTRKGMEIKLPKLVNGQKVTIVARSANGDAKDRGFVAGNSNLTYNTELSTSPDGICLGNKVEGSLGTYTLVWDVTTDETDSVDIVIKTSPNGGLDISSIMIDEGDITKTTEVGYLFMPLDGYLLDDDPIYNQLVSLSWVNVTPVDVSTALTAEQLQAFQTIVLANNIPADNENVSLLKQTFPFVPTLNFNGNLYAAWGYGELGEKSTEVAVLKTTDKTFTADLEIAEEDAIKMISLTNGEAIPAGIINLTGPFADDVIYAVDLENPDLIYSHAHNINHNGYIYLPFDAEAAEDMYEPNAIIINNALTKLAESKAIITPTTAPKIAVKDGDHKAVVTITDAIKNAQIFYTTDGTDPTIESTLYAEPFTLTADCTVKAVALGEGYTLSEIVSADVTMKDQVKAPVVNVSGNGQTEPALITISLAEAPAEGDTLDIWYNYTGSEDTLKSTKYTEPILVQTTVEPKTVYAFVTSKLVVASELTSAVVKANMSNIRREVITHFDASGADWNAGNNALAYYFSWGKTARSMYLEDVDPESGEIIYILNTPEIAYPNPTGEIANAYNNDWKLKSYGQVLDWPKATIEKLNAGDGTAYNPWKVDDLDNDLVTNGSIQFGSYFSEESANASIETVKPFKGPFNIYFTIGNGATNVKADRVSYVSPRSFEIAVSTDTINWTRLDSIASPTNQRCWTIFEIPYEGTDDVYVRLKQLSGGSNAYCTDIYLFGKSASGTLLGDADEDGSVTVADITTIAAYILGKTPEMFNFTNADVDADGAITVADITGTAGIILGK